MYRVADLDIVLDPSNVLAIFKRYMIWHSRKCTAVTTNAVADTLQGLPMMTTPCTDAVYERVTGTKPGMAGMNS
jgi:hypothetical protein